MFDDALLDDPDALARADPALRRLAETGARVRRELDAAASTLTSLRDGTRPRAVVVTGRDARLLRAVLEPWCPVPFVAWAGPALPGWVGPLDVVVVFAQTGADQFVAEAVTEAVRRGSGLVVACPEHSAVAELAAGRYTTVVPTTTEDPLAGAVVVLQALHALELGPEVDGEEVATALDDVAVRCSPFHDLGANEAKDLASSIGDATPLLWGGSVLAARAARRIAEAIRRSSGRAALATEADHLLPVIESLQPHDLFADPFDSDGGADVGTVLLLVDDGTEDSAMREQRGRLLAACERQGQRVSTLACDHGSELARYASLLALGSYCAVYLGVALDVDAPTDQGD